jgi:hypothetical protein
MKMKHILLLLGFSLFFTAAQAQRFGKDSISCITNLSLYIEDYKLYREGTGSDASVDNMIRAWRWVFKHCPEATENIYIDGVNILELMIERAGNDAEKARLIDTLSMLYDQRIRYFGKEGFVLGRKGVDLYTKDPGRYEEAYKALKKSVSLEKNKSNPAVLVYYFRIAVKMLRSDKITKSELVDAYDVVSTIIDHNLRQGSKASFENAQRNVELTFEPYASCDDLISIYQAKFKAAPGDAENLRKIISILEKKSCTDSDLFFEVTIKLNEIEPSPESSYLIGKMFIRRGDQARALPYLEKGTAMTDPNDLADCNLLLANARFHFKNFPQARAAALEAARLRSNDGRPYLLIGDMYASSAESCGDNKLTRKVAYWAAVDKYTKAKSVDSRLEQEANEKIATYSRYFPPLEDIFFYELTEGQSYTVACWINETTTVRAVKQ